MFPCGETSNSQRSRRKAPPSSKPGRSSVCKTQPSSTDSVKYRVPVTPAALRVSAGVGARSVVVVVLS